MSLFDEGQPASPLEVMKGGLPHHWKTRPVTSLKHRGAMLTDLRNFLVPGFMEFKLCDAVACLYSLEGRSRIVFTPFCDECRKPYLSWMIAKGAQSISMLSRDYVVILRPI